MKNFTILVLLFIASACTFKSSSDYYIEAEKLEFEERYEEAILLLDKAIKLDPTNIYALMNRGVDKSLLGDYEGAIQDYSAILALDSDNTLALFNRAKNHKRIGDFESSIADCNKAIQTKGGELLYFEIEEHPYFDTGYEFDVLMEEIRFERGIGWINLDSLQLAFGDFSFCLEKGYEVAECLYWRGLIHIAYGANELGCADLNKSKDLGDPDAKIQITEHCK